MCVWSLGIQEIREKWVFHSSTYFVNIIYKMTLCMCTTNTSVHTNYYRKQFYCNNAEFLYLFGTKWAESAMAIESLNVVTDW